MARVLPSVWGAGSAILLAVVLAGGVASSARGHFLIVDAAGWLVAATLVAGRTRLPDWWFELTQYIGILIVSSLVVISDDPASPFALFYLWLVVQTTFFGDWRRAAAQGIAAGASYAGALALVSEGGFPAVQWIMLMATFVVTLTIVAYMRSRLDALVLRLNAAAQTDELTGLGNRRRLLGDLKRAIATATEHATVSVAMFDLDGFKGYNDTYGHPAGDALLSRVASRLRRAMSGRGTGYRLGGDEFCVILHGPASEREEAVRRATGALTDHGKGFDITASCGVAEVPVEADTIAAVLGLADRRLYQEKLGRRPTTDRRWPYIVESADPDGWTSRVAPQVGARLGMEGQDLEVLTRAAQLHDIGKVALPDELLRKSEPLSPDELDFVRHHVLVGERLLRGAEPLGPVARVVRGTLERWDGGGYPDALEGDRIPRASRIIAVCEAFEAMTGDRDYRPSLTPGDALAELRQCAGSQFDPAVVGALSELLDDEPELTFPAPVEDTT